MWTQSSEGPRSRCFTLGLWFHVGFRADLVIFFYVISCRAYVWDAWRIEIHCFENGRTPQVSLRSRPWRGLSKVRCFMSGWGFVSGLRVPKVLSFTQAHLCDTPFCNISRDNCAIPHKNKRERVLRYYRCKYRAI